MDPTTPPAKPPRAASHRPRDIAFRDVVTRDEAAWLARRCLGEDARLVEYYLRPYSEEKIGFLGQHLRLVIVAKVSSSGSSSEAVDEKLSLFVKTVPRDLPGQAAYIEEKGCFRKESDFFRDYVALIGDEEEATSWCPTCYLAKPDVLVFEDLRLRGYANQPRMFELAAMKSAVVCLARFHASSLRLEARLGGRPLVDRFPRLLEETEFKRSGRSLEWYANAMDLAVRLARERFGHEDEAGLRRAGDTVFAMCRASRDKLNVVSHGDLWSSNLMFDAGLRHCRLVDYQLLRYAPLGHDLAQLLYLCSTRDFRRRNEAKMIELYTETLLERLSTTRYEGPRPEREDILRCYEEQRMPACATAVIFHPTVLMSGRVAAQIMDEPATYEEYYFRNRLPFVRRIMAGDKEYEARILEDVEELVEMSRRYDDLPKPT
ncbi:uncharacterized protein LOC111693711 [Trichogramma pretiosum]|uniref:uncharacterized protein LOC111693711 n=1 Tax=Trichogramma pretiosum TaxID=7493 RepID=UPI000C71C302|nr:uncharacterized protein LOC111693711 [Trichogramma pretiosum]